MALDPVKNFLYSTLASGIAIDATSMTVATGDGSKFPDPASGQYNLVIYNSVDYPSAALDPERSIIRATALTGDVFTIQQPSVGNDYNGEGSDNIARAHNTEGKVYAVELNLTKRSIDTIGTELGLKENAANKKTSLTDNSDTYYPTQKAVKTAVDLKQDALGYIAENVANKSTNVTTDGASDTKYPSAKAVKDYADGKVAGAVNYRGAYDASVNTFPATGGSGTAGAILKGNTWVISVAGTLGGEAIQVGDWIIANVDTPGQTTGNWDKLNTNLTYVPEDSANKKTSLADNSDTYYPTQKAVKTAVDAKQDALTFGIANTNAVKVDDASVADNDYAKFTANGIEGVPYSTVLSDIGAQAALGYTAEDVANKKTNLTDNSDAYYPTQKAVKTAVDAKTDKSTLTTKGDIYAASAASTPARVGVGTNGQVLTADSTQATGVKWADAGTANALPLAGGTMTGGIVLATGSTTVAPIKMVAGTNLTTPVAGVMEFDGTDLYFTI